MSCSYCSRRTLGSFIRSFTHLQLPQASRSTNAQPIRATRSFSAAARVRDTEQTAATPKRTPKHNAPIRTAETDRLHTKTASAAKKREPWQIQKGALKEKFGGEAWNPRKKLSPDTMEGIRHLHQTHPEKFTTAVLSQHFKVSPEAIRRILKSKWRPSDDEYEDRLRRWDKRGEKIWSNLVELGVKPPKKWREMGVGRARDGQIPKWKSKARNKVPVNESASNEVLDDDDIIPIVDGVTGETISSQRQSSAFGDRLL